MRVIDAKDDRGEDSYYHRVMCLIVLHASRCALFYCTATCRFEHGRTLAPAHARRARTRVELPDFWFNHRMHGWCHCS